MPLPALVKVNPFRFKMPFCAFVPPMKRVFAPARVALSLNITSCNWPRMAELLLVMTVPPAPGPLMVTGLPNMDAVRSWPLRSSVPGLVTTMSEPKAVLVPSFNMPAATMVSPA